MSEDANKPFAGPVITVDDNDKKHMYLEVKIPLEAFDNYPHMNRHLLPDLDKLAYEAFIEQKLQNPNLNPKCHDELLSAPLYQISYNYYCQACGEETEVPDPVEFHPEMHYCGRSAFCLP